jgi:hypothetical protein
MMLVSPPQQVKRDAAIRIVENLVRCTARSVILRKNVLQVRHVEVRHTAAPGSPLFPEPNETFKSFGKREAHLPMEQIKVETCYSEPQRPCLNALRVPSAEASEGSILLTRPGHG